MREGQFINQNKERWENYEHSTSDPDELAKRFTNLVDDLSYSKTFFPAGNTTSYLNNLAANIYLSIYKNRKEKSNRIVTFWTHELPLVIWRHQKTLMFALLYFLAFVLFGIFSQMNDQTFIRSILGDKYVDMTEDNIASGDPFGVYKDGNTLAMWVYLAFHNIKLAFFTYIGGIILCIGSLYFLMTNGIMLGSFETMFFQHHVGFQSILVVFIHGTLEISALVIAGGAGLILGNSWLFPKTFTRIQSLKQGAKDGAKIMVAIIPILATAAFFETYITRYTDMPLPLSLSILIGSLAFMLFYFVWYPIKVAKKVQLENEAAR